MQLVIKEKKDNKLLHRTELHGELGFDGPTPKRDDVRAEIAKQLKKPSEVIAVKHIYSQYGGNKATVEAYAYESREKLEEIEPAKLHKRVAEAKPEEKKVTEEQAAAEKPEEKKEAAEEKAEEKPAEAPKEEAKEAPAPAEEKAEEKPAEAPAEEKKEETEEKKEEPAQENTEEKEPAEKEAEKSE